MPRPFYPHTMNDLVRAVDGGLGLVVGDLPDGSIWVLKRERKLGGYTLTHYSDGQRSRTLEQCSIAERGPALNAMAEAIGLDERI